MAWAVATDGTNYQYRIALTVDTSGATPGGPAVVARANLGAELEHFWANVQANGYDVMIATASGNAIAHERATWTYASKIAQFDFSVTLNTDADSGAMAVVYLYYTAGATIAVDPSTAVAAHSVDAYPEPGRLIPDGRAVLWDSPSWRQSTASNTPAPLQTVGVGVGEVRHFFVSLGPSLRYQTGYSFRGFDVFEDVDWVYVEVTGVDPSAPNWMLPGNLRLFVDENGPTVRGLVNVQDDSDGLATLRVGWSSSYSTIEEHYLKLRGLAPAI